VHLEGGRLKAVRLFSMMWGKPYVDLFEQACAKSLNWPKNREAAKRFQAWDLWTTPQEQWRVRDIASALGVPLCLHPTLNVSTMKANFQALVGEIQLCEERGAAFLFAAPDSIFGDGSVGSLLEIGEPQRVCVAAAPMRVRETILPELGTNIPNSVLVGLGFKHMHRYFAEAKVGEKTNSLSTGISWKLIGEGLYAVQYRNYSSYYMTPEKKDVEWFRLRPRLGYYDSVFPETLIPDQRQRVVGSSDAVFVAEVTPDSRALPPLTVADAEPDKFEGSLAHHVANRGLTCIWRSECN
jgi:hypothetical protein